MVSLRTFCPFPCPLLILSPSLGSDVNRLGIVAGNPQVTQPGLHPYLHLPVPATHMGLPIETSPKTLAGAGVTGD